MAYFKIGKFRNNSVNLWQFRAACSAAAGAVSMVGKTGVDAPNKTADVIIADFNMALFSLSQDVNVRRMALRLGG